MNPHKPLAIAFAASLTVLFLAPWALADHEACKDDVQKFCSGEKPGGGRIARCLKQHESELSPPCKERVAEVKDAIQACHDDAARLCKDEKPGRGRIVKCLNAHEGELSEGCKTALQGAKK